MKKFNVTGLCIKEKHYMADTGGKIEKILELIDEGFYFAISRARQYGKTTTLHLIKESLPDGYICISLSFEGVGETMFRSPADFCQAFLLHISKALNRTDREFAAMWPDKSITDFDLLGYHIDGLCKDRKIVLLIDEVDKASDNQVFLYFLGMLRNRYSALQTGDANAFHSVILTGVYDIRNIKLKLVNEGIHPEPGKIYNSPWNIAVSFDVDMSLNTAEISAMLVEYENDYHTGMDISVISREIYEYTNGYPYLVSRLCQCIDRELGRDWSERGIKKAVDAVLHEDSVLFDDLFKNLEQYKDLYAFMYDFLITGDKKYYTTDDPVVRLGSMFGYIRSDNGGENTLRGGLAVIANKIFEIRITNYFLSRDENAKRMKPPVSAGLIRDITENGIFNMELCLRKFAEHYKEIFSKGDIPFLERHGRLVFLSFLRPLINGHGFYHIESQFTDFRRMDIVVDYGQDQFIVELKLWKGESARDAAYEQLLDYMDSKNSAKGYLLTFDFRKNKENKAEWVQTGDKLIFDVIV